MKPPGSDQPPATGAPAPVPDFPTTHWTLVTRVRQGGEVRPAALEELCRLYWYPIYVFLRRRGYAQHDAEDLTQGFFVKLLGDETFDAARGDKGRLRTFLLCAMDRHLADQQRRLGAQKRGGGQQIISFEELHAEERYALEPQDRRDPEWLFTQAWAQLLIDGVRGGGGNPYLWDISGDTNAFAIAISGVGYPFLIKKSNGYVGINNTAPTAPLHVGGEAKATVFTPTSDRNAKQDFTPVNPREILEKVVALPITEWTYKTIAGARHLGPVAQDFRAAFGLGSDDKGISTVDADGVALASIQALNEKLNEKDAEVQELKQSVEELKELVRSLAKKQ